MLLSLGLDEILTFILDILQMQMISHNVVQKGLKMSKKKCNQGLILGIYLLIYPTSYLLPPVFELICSQVFFMLWHSDISFV